MIRTEAHRPERAALDKLSHEDVNYEHPSAHPPEKCSGCVHFIRANPARCQNVKPPIRVMDRCEHFKSKDEE